MFQVLEKDKNIVTGEAAEDNLCTVECCSIKINISTYFEWSLLFFVLK